MNLPDAYKGELGIVVFQLPNGTYEPLSKPSRKDAVLETQGRARVLPNDRFVGYIFDVNGNLYWDVIVPALNDVPKETKLDAKGLDALILQKLQEQKEKA